MIKAVIFDMDGVLIDSEPPNLLNIANFFALHGKYAEESYLHALVGRSAHDTWDITCQAWGEPISYDEFHQQLHAYCEAHPLDYPSILFDGVRELLQWLKKEGYRIAVASSSDMSKIKEVMEACAISDYFDVFVSGQYCTHSKPDPEIYIYAASLLHMPIENCVAIEDSKAGIASAHGAHMKVIAKIDERYGADASLADAQVHEIIEIKDLLKQWR